MEAYWETRASETSHPETILPCLSLREANQIVQNGISFLLRAEIKYHSKDPAKHFVVKILN